MARKREQVCITPDPNVVEWVDANSGPGKRFYNRTHAFEYAIIFLQENERWPPPAGLAASPSTPTPTPRRDEAPGRPPKSHAPRPEKP